MLSAELLNAIEQSFIAESLRYWRWAYPIANGSHILGIALLFGAIVPLDLRLLGLWRSVPVANLAKALVPVAATGLILALLTGPLLFSVDPIHYAGLWLFWLKLTLILAALINLLLVLRSRSWQQFKIDLTLRLGALFSLLLWLAVILAGRLLAYV